jgi:hypothetical protein
VRRIVVKCTSSLTDLTDPAAQPQLDERLAAIREHEAVFWSDIQQGYCHALADVAEGFGGKLPLSTARLGKLAFASIPEHEWQSRIPLLTTVTPTWVNMTDPPHHARLRKPMMNAFSKSNVETMRAFVLARLQQLFKRRTAPEIEFIRRSPGRLTGSVIMKLMGVPEEHLANLRDWANSLSWRSVRRVREPSLARRRRSCHARDERGLQARTRASQGPAAGRFPVGARRRG